MVVQTMIAAQPLTFATWDNSGIKLLSDALANPHYDNWREKMAFIQSLLRKNAPDLPVEDLRLYLKAARAVQVGDNSLTRDRAATGVGPL
jgi:hypothetical protein